MKRKHATSAAWFLLGTVLLWVVVCACSKRADPRKLLDGAIEAHGGRERLATLDNVAVVSKARYKGTVELLRRLQYRAPQTWRMALELRGTPVMAFGVDGERCWRKDRHFVSACSDEDRQEHARVSRIMIARFLHRLDPATLAESPSVELEGKSAPALKAGELQLVFDPEKRLLRQIRYGDDVETFSEFRDVGGALVGARRVLTIGGELDVDETWTEIVPGAVKPADVAPPPLAADGVIVDELDFERPVAWTEVENVGPALAQTVSQLESFAKQRGHSVSSSDGLVLIPSGADRWKVAITLEPGQPLASANQGALHLEKWPRKHIFGVFLQGDATSLIARRSRLDDELGKRGKRIRPGAEPELVCISCFREGGGAQLMLLRIEVEQLAGNTRHR